MISGLPSSLSANGFPSLFKRFIGTAPLSDSSETCTWVVRPKPFPTGLSCGSLQAPPRSPGSRVWSFQTCVGSTTTQDQPGTCVDAPVRMAFRFDDSVGVPIAIFRSSIPSPSVPLFTLQRWLHSARCKTRGRVVRYSFLVRLLHPLSHAGLSRRTVNYFFGLTTTISPDRVLIVADQYPPLIGRVMRMSR